MFYRPNPAHKQETTEAGPPRWSPNKTPCPLITVPERNALFESSIPEDPDNPRSRRYALRRMPTGLEFFEAKFTCFEPARGDDEFHGHPTSDIPGRVLREFLRRRLITDAEYNWLRKELG